MFDVAGSPDSQRLEYVLIFCPVLLILLPGEGSEVDFRVHVSHDIPLPLAVFAVFQHCAFFLQFDEGVLVGKWHVSQLPPGKNKLKLKIVN